ncbi:tRNA pseudouridine(55) synthase [hydrothermal vent metagenome]|uniref:tRNA pseudouridine(55) synthase n=1 Tax=hydrothermal vent metagenome TaxID=652676 RepID=A0A3B0VIP4_9ZZZZ
MQVKLPEERSPGVFLIDKPCGPTSFKIVHYIRKALGIKKVGHSGTLDPFASGLLIVCAGRPATRIISQLMGGDKEYLALLRLGISTDTQDFTGRIVSERPVPEFERSVIDQCVSRFAGRHYQMPPAYSALKHKGRPLYYYARKGIKIDKPPRLVTINELEIVDSVPSRLRLDAGPDSGPEICIRVRCGKGVYIRTLAADIGEALGCGAHLLGLRRTVNGPFSVNEAVDGERLVNAEEALTILQGGIKSVEEVLAAFDHETAARPM